MTISKELIDSVRQSLRFAQAAYNAKIAECTKMQHDQAAEIIGKIPQLIADAIAAKQDFAQICVMHDQGEYFGRDPKALLFKIEGWKGRYLSHEPKPEWLIGASKLIYDYCLTNDLRPKLLAYHVEGTGGWSFSDTYSDTGTWTASKLIIRWQPEHLEKLLRGNNGSSIVEDLLANPEQLKLLALKLAKCG